MRVLIIKTSSLGDVVHAMPAVMDSQAAFPNAQIDWVVERGFAPLAARCAAVHRVSPCDLRRWRKAFLKAETRAQTRAEWQAFKADLQQEAYDVILDLQGLTKSAWVSWLARKAKGGKRYALANRTDGSGYERPTRWVADVAIEIEPHVHAVQRSRILCAAALGYDLQGPALAGLRAGALAAAAPLAGADEPTRSAETLAQALHATLTPAQREVVELNTSLEQLVRERTASLSRERERLQNILRGTNAGTWEWNVQTGERLYNARWAEMVGLTLDELNTMGPGAWQQLIHGNWQPSRCLPWDHLEGPLSKSTLLKHRNTSLTGL